MSSFGVPLGSNSQDDRDERPTDGEIMRPIPLPGPGEDMRWTIRVWGKNREDVWTNVANALPAPPDYDMVSPTVGTPVFLSWKNDVCRVCIPWSPKVTACGGTP